MEDYSAPARAAPAAGMATGVAAAAAPVLADTAELLAAAALRAAGMAVEPA